MKRASSVIASMAVGAVTDGLIVVFCILMLPAGLVGALLWQRPHRMPALDEREPPGYPPEGQE